MCLGILPVLDRAPLWAGSPLYRGDSRDLHSVLATLDYQNLQLGQPPSEEGLDQVLIQQVSELTAEGSRNAAPVSFLSLSVL